jgi:PPOX class probable F420-dependent enzyme
MQTFEQFKKQQYMSIETYRKSGEGVRTPVWFIESNGEYCFNTESDSGKVKRIRRNPAVRIAPCTVRGDLKGDFIPGIARILPAEEAEKVKKSYAKKYGLMGLIFESMGRSRKTERIFLAIKPESAAP